MSDYELQLKIRNAPLLNRMREMGIKNAAQLARAANVQPSLVGDMLALKQPLYSPRKGARGPEVGTIRQTYQRVADALGCSPQDLYPESHWFSKLDQHTFSAQVSEAQMESLAHASTGDPLALLEHMSGDWAVDVDDLIAGKNSTLTKREQRVLHARFADEKTLEETAAQFDLSKERIRQIEAKALRKLRNPENPEHNRLRQALDAINEGS